ncbi:hypothetical protein D3C86_1504260 [compost metagenome]
MFQCFVQCISFGNQLFCFGNFLCICLFELQLLIDLLDFCFCFCIFFIQRQYLFEFCFRSRVLLRRQCSIPFGNQLSDLLFQSICFRNFIQFYFCFRNFIFRVSCRCFESQGFVVFRYSFRPFFFSHQGIPGSNGIVVFLFFILFCFLGI